MKLISRIAATGVPALVTELSSGIVIIVFNMIIMSLAGNVGVAAYGIAANIFIVVVSIYNGIAQGMQPLASKSSGEGDSAASHSYLRLALISGAIVSVMVYICIFFFADPIAGIFNSEKDPALQEIAIQGLRLYLSAAFCRLQRYKGSVSFSCGNIRSRKPYLHSQGLCGDNPRRSGNVGTVGS